MNLRAELHVPGGSGEQDFLGQLETCNPAFGLARVVEPGVDHPGADRGKASQMLGRPDGLGGVEIERNLAAGKVVCESTQQRREVMLAQEPAAWSRGTTAAPG